MAILQKVIAMPLAAARRIRKLLETPALAGLGCAVAAVTVAGVLKQHEHQSFQQRVRHESRYAQAELEWELRLIDLSLQRMVHRMEQQPPVGRELWESDARDYLRDFAALKELRWIDLDSGQQWVVTTAKPETGSHTAVDHRLIEAAASEGAPHAALLNDEASGAMRRLIVPTSDDAARRGALVSLLDFEAFVADALQDERALGWAYRLESESVAIASPGAPPRQHFETHPTNVRFTESGRPWRLSLAPGAELRQAARSWLAELVLAIGLLGAVAVIIVLRVIHHARRRESQLEQTNLRLAQVKRNHDRSEAARQESDALLRAVLEILPAMVYVKDPDGRHRFTNRASEQVLNMDAASIIGRRDDEVLPPKVAAPLMANDQRVLQTGEQLEFEERVTHTDGTEHIYLSRKFPLRDSDGKIFAIAGVSTDITRQRAIESELERARERLELCVRGTSDGLWDWDLCTNEVWYAPRFRQLLGYANEADFPNRFESLFGHLHPDDRADAMQAIEHHLQTDEPFDAEYRLRTRSGDHRWFRARGLSIRNESGEPVRMAGSIQDIHERKQIEMERQRLVTDLGERVKELSTLYGVARVLQETQTTIDAMLQSVVGLLESGYQHADVAAARIVFDGTEYTSANWLPSRWMQCSEFRTDDGREGSVAVVYLEQRPDADEGPFLTEERRLLDTIASRLCARLDRLHTDAQLRHSEERFRTLVANIPGVVYRCRLDEQWTMIYLSDAAEELTGIPASEFIGPNGRTFAELIDPEDNARNTALVRKAAERDEPFELEYRLRHVDGSQRWVIEKGQCVRNDRGEIVYLDGVLFDVTELQRAREIEQEHQHLQDAVRAMEQVLAVVGHELRTPLAAIRATTELLITSNESAVDDQAQFLTSVHDEAVRMAQMVNNMLEAARLNSGHARWNWSAVELQRVCDEAIAVVRPLVDQRNVTFTTLVEPTTLQMSGDHDAIQRLVINLVSNAAKFTSAGSISVAVREHACDGERWIELRVSDTGEGISDEKVRKLGQAFVLNAGVVGSDYVKGSGLGLAICTGIVEAHGGSISVSSEIGVGSTFTARLRADLPGPKDAVVTKTHQKRTAAA